MKTTVAAMKLLQTTIGVLVDRLPGDDGSAATVYIDAVDFEVFEAKATK